MAEAFVITLYKTTDLVSGELKVVQLDTSISALWLRKFDDAGTYTTQYSLTSLGNAKFLAEVPDGRYQLWKSAYPDATAGNRMDFWHGGDAKFKWVSDKDMSYAALSGNNTYTGTNTFNGDTVFGGDIQLGSGDYIHVTEDALINSQLPNLGQVNTLIAAMVDPTELTTALAAELVANKLIFPQMTDGALDQNIYATWTFRDAGAIPYILATPTSPFHAANVKFVKDWVNNYLTGNITFQQTETIIIIDFDCTQEDNRRYFSITGAIAVANAYADVGTRVTLYVEGGNVDNLIAAGNLAYMVLPDTGADYVDIVGMAQQVWITLEDTAYTTATVGKKVIQNITLSNPGSSSTTFSKYIFRNVKFIGAAGSSNIAFTDCVFENCSKDSTVAMTYTTCIGEIFDVSNSQKLIFNTIKDEGGAYEIAYANGDIRGKRILGRQGTNISSATSITLGEGNFFVISGTTTIATIVTTNWTDGSVVHLYFGGALTLDVSGGNIVRNTGGNLSVAAGQIVSFLMDSNSWIIINY